MSEAEGPEHNPDRLLQEIAIFSDVARAITSSLDLDAILQIVMDRIAEFFRPSAWSLLMVDDQKDELYFAIAAGDGAQTLKSVRLKVGEALLAGWPSMANPLLSPMFIPTLASPSAWMK